MIPLRARPIVKKVNQRIVIPKVVRPAQLSPSPPVTRRLIAAARLTPRQDARRALSPVKQHRVAPALNVDRGIRKNLAKLPIKSIPDQVSEAHREAIKSLRNTGTGRILLIIGNGPSIVECNFEPLAHHPLIDVMSINKPDLRLWPTKYWLFCDISQLQRHRDIWNTYDGVIFNSTMISEARHGTVVIPTLPGEGFSLDLVRGFHIGRSSVYAAMQVAIWLNYDRIYIFGIDMSAVVINGQKLVHFFGINPDALPENRVKRFDDEAKFYTQAGNELPEAIRKKFFFCSRYNPYQFIDRFNRLDHVEATAEIVKYVESPQSPV